jgi:hypothetical protein
MKITLLPLAAVALALVSGCATMSTSKVIGVSYDKGDLQRVESSKTYKWAVAKSVNPYNNQELYLQLVESDVDTQMSKKGYQLAKDGKADLKLSYLMIYQDGETTAMVDKFFGTNRVPESLLAAGDHGPKLDYEVGTLVVEVEDARDGESLWRGVVSAKVDRSKPYEVQKKRIAAAVSAVMKNFPTAK